MRPDEVLAEPAVDLVVRGEGEVTLGEIAAERPPESIEGISYRQEGQVVHNRCAGVDRRSGFAAYARLSLLPMEKYRSAVGAAKRKPATSVLATRGCPGPLHLLLPHLRPPAALPLRPQSGRGGETAPGAIQDSRDLFLRRHLHGRAPEVRAFCLALRT